MAIRIVHVVEGFGVGGGVENGIANLIERLEPNRFEHVLCGVFRLGPQVERYPAGRVRLMCLEQKPRRLALQVRPLVEMIRSVHPDIVHSRNWGAAEAVVAARWAGRCRVIHSEHGFEMNPAAEPSRRSWARRGVFELAHRVFCVSSGLRALLARRTGFPVHKMGVIHNGVDTRRFQPDPAAGQQFRRELGIAEEEFCVGCVGRLNRIKDYPTMLHAAEGLSRSSVPWRLLIAGGGVELPALEEFVRSRPALQGRVQFLGPTKRIPELLNAIDAYVLPSLYEGISNSLLEAMAAGRAVVVSNTGGNPEVVVDGESGLLFPVGDFERLAGSLLQLWHERDLREQLGGQARRRVQEEFSLDVMVRRYDTMYRSLVGDRTAEPAEVEEAAMLSVRQTGNGGV